MDFGREFIAYDTFCSIKISSESRKQAERLLSESEDIALTVEKTLNMYDLESELSRLCSKYIVGEKYHVSPMLKDFLEWNKIFYEISGGIFDPTVGPLVKLWDFLADDPIIPTDSEIEQVKSTVGFHHVHIEEDDVWFDLPGVVIDPGASGKGYALELVASHLRQNGIHNALLNFGGNMFSLGGKADIDDTPWKIAILDPDHLDTYIGTVLMKNNGIATSSWYEHSFEKNGEVFHHLLNPITGKSEPLKVKSVSVISSNAAFTDFLSTSLFLLPEDKGKRLIDDLKKRFDEQIEVVMVRADRSIFSSSTSFERKENYS